MTLNNVFFNDKEIQVNLNCIKPLFTDIRMNFSASGEMGENKGLRNLRKKN